MNRSLTERERAVPDALLAVDFDGAEELRRQAPTAQVVRLCGCGCPSVDFHRAPGLGMHIRVNAAIEGSDDGLFLFTVGDQLRGIEYVGASGEGDPTELPEPALLRVEVASGTSPREDEGAEPYIYYCVRTPTIVERLEVPCRPSILSP